MARFADTETDQYGRPLVGALVLVTRQDGAEAVMTDDTGGVLANPLVTDSLGSYYFNATDAFYNIETRFGGLIRRRDFGRPIGALLSQISTGDSFDDGLWNAADTIIDDGIWG